MRVFLFITLAVLTLSLGATTPIGATETPTDDGLDAEDVRTIVNETDPGDADLETIRDVAEWTRSVNVSDQLGEDDARALQEWVTDAADQPNLDVPDVQVNVTSGAPTSTRDDTSGAPSTTSTPTATETPSPTPTATSAPAPASTPNASGIEVQVDQNTKIVGQQYLADEGIVRLTVFSAIRQDVTLTDAGKFSTGGTVAEETLTMRGGDTATADLPVTVVEGQVGIGIRTQEKLYAHIIQANGGGGLGILEAVSVMQAWIGGVTIAFVWTVIAGWSVIRREGGRPEVAT